MEGPQLAGTGFLRSGSVDWISQARWWLPPLRSYSTKVPARSRCSSKRRMRCRRFRIVPSAVPISSAVLVLTCPLAARLCLLSGGLRGRCPPAVLKTHGTCTNVQVKNCTNGRCAPGDRALYWKMGMPGWQEHLIGLAEGGGDRSGKRNCTGRETLLDVNSAVRLA